MSLFFLKKFSIPGFKVGCRFSPADSQVGNQFRQAKTAPYFSQLIIKFKNEPFMWRARRDRHIVVLMWVFSSFNAWSSVMALVFFTSLGERFSFEDLLNHFWRCSYWLRLDQENWIFSGTNSVAVAPHWDVCRRPCLRRSCVLHTSPEVAWQWLTSIYFRFPGLPSSIGHVEAWLKLVGGASYCRF